MYKERARRGKRGGEGMRMCNIYPPLLYVNILVGSPMPPLLNQNLLESIYYSPTTLAQTQKNYLYKFEADPTLRKQPTRIYIEH